MKLKYKHKRMIYAISGLILREVAGRVCIGIQYDWWLEKNWICHECNNQLYICG